MKKENKIAFITGAGKGIGLETARGLGRQGVHVILGVRNVRQGELAITELRNENITADLLSFDLAKIEDRQKAFACFSEKFGRLDILINNAGIWLESDNASTFPTSTAATLDMKILKSIFDTNFFDTVALTQELIPLLKQSSAGRIVNVSSIMGSLALHADPESPIYNIKVFGYDASKAALNQFTIHLAHALKDTKIKVNSVHPGWVKSDMGGDAAYLDIKEGSETSIHYSLLPDDGPTGGFFFKTETVSW